MKIPYIILLILTTSVCQAQDIQGSYKEKKIAGEEGRIIVFNNGTFNEVVTGDISTKKGYGSYGFKNNNLIFNYKPYPKQDSSSYELINLSSSSHSNIELAIFDSDTVAMYGNYGIRDYKNNVLNIVGTDKNGAGNMIIFDNKAIGYFTIDRIGYYRISIPIKRLMGKSLTIRAYLRLQKYFYMEPEIVSYKIIKITSKQLILSQKGINYIFEKTN